MRWYRLQSTAGLYTITTLMEVSGGTVSCSMVVPTMWWYLARGRRNLPVVNGLLTLMMRLIERKLWRLSGAINRAG